MRSPGPSTRSTRCCRPPAPAPSPQTARAGFATPTGVGRLTPDLQVCPGPQGTSLRAMGCSSACWLGGRSCTPGDDRRRWARGRWGARCASSMMMRRHAWRIDRPLLLQGKRAQARGRQGQGGEAAPYHDKRRAGNGAWQGDLKLENPLFEEYYRAQARRGRRARRPACVRRAARRRRCAGAGNRAGRRVGRVHGRAARAAADQLSYQRRRQVCGHAAGPPGDRLLQPVWQRAARGARPPAPAGAQRRRAARAAVQHAAGRRRWTARSWRRRARWSGTPTGSRGAPHAPATASAAPRPRTAPSPACRAQAVCLQPLAAAQAPRAQRPARDGAGGAARARRARPVGNGA